MEARSVKKRLFSFVHSKTIWVIKMTDNFNANVPLKERWTDDTTWCLFMYSPATAAVADMLWGEPEWAAQDFCSARPARAHLERHVWSDSGGSQHPAETRSFGCQRFRGQITQIQRPTLTAAHTLSVCVCVCLHVPLRVRAHVHVCPCSCLRAHTCMRVCSRVSVAVCVHALCVRACACLRVVCVRLCVCIWQDPL